MIAVGHDRHGSTEDARVYLLSDLPRETLLGIADSLVVGPKEIRLQAGGS